MSDQPRQPILSAKPRKNRLTRAFESYRRGGAEYFWHKSMRRLLENDSPIKRKLVYSDPRKYWTLRGGSEYLAEQEGQPARTARSEWFAEKVASCQAASILEVGCGYGKQLQAIRAAVGDQVLLTGIDFRAEKRIKRADFNSTHQQLCLRTRRSPKRPPPRIPGKAA